MKWDYKLKSGKKLRKALFDEDVDKIIDALYDCYAELLDAGFIDEDDYDRYTEDFDFYDADDVESIDYELDNLYDLCDSLRVWVEI